MNKTIKDLRKLDKNQLVYAVYQLENRHKQAITDYAMEVNRLKVDLETWKKMYHDQVEFKDSAERELKQSRAFVARQEQVIRELGNAVTKLGECIAHL